jgi:hypothetical protein
MRAIVTPLRCFVIASICAVLGGCVSVPSHGLSSDDLQRYRIVDVTVEGAEMIRSWPAEEEAFLKTATVDPETVNRIRTEPASNFPQLTGHFRHVLNARIGNGLTQATGDILTGSQPVRAVVRLREFDIPSVARRVFVDNHTKIKADIDIVDRATGRLILRYEGPSTIGTRIGGLGTGIALAFEPSDLGTSMIADYLSAYRNWLLRK